MESGEKSLIWIDGEVTHGVLKRAKSGDFRVQDDHGGTVAPLAVTQTDKDLAQDIMTKCLARPKFKRFRDRLVGDVREKPPCAEAKCMTEWWWPYRH